MAPGVQFQGVWSRRMVWGYGPGGMVLGVKGTVGRQGTTPVDRMTNTCDHITSPQLHLRAVMTGLLNLHVC